MTKNKFKKITIKKEMNEIKMNNNTTGVFGKINGKITETKRIIAIADITNIIYGMHRKKAISNLKNKNTKITNKELFQEICTLSIKCIGENTNARGTYRI